MDTTRDLAEFIAANDVGQIPGDVVERARLCFEDWLGLVVAGSREPEYRLLYDTVVDVPNGSGLLVGRAGRTSVPEAALLNGIAAHALDFDDTAQTGRVHVSTVVMTASATLATSVHASGLDLLTAFVTGAETQIRIGEVLGLQILEKGWHPTPVCGVFGAAAAAASLLHLSPDQTACALGIAASRSSGLAANFGTMTKPFHAGAAASDGIMASLLASRGFTANREVLDGEHGFLRLLHPEASIPRLLDGLGNNDRLRHLGFKPYPSCLATHAPIDAMRSARRQFQLQPGSVERIDVEVNPLSIQVAGKPRPRTGLEGKFSIPYCVVVALMDDYPVPEHFLESSVNRPEFQQMLNVVNLVSNPSIELTEATVEVVGKDGQVLRAHVESPLGDPKNPLSRAEIDRKFRGLVAPILGERSADRLLTLAHGLDSVEDIGAVILASQEEVDRV